MEFTVTAQFRDRWDRPNYHEVTIHCNERQWIYTDCSIAVYLWAMSFLSQARFASSWHSGSGGETTIQVVC